MVIAMAMSGLMGIFYVSFNLRAIYALSKRAAEKSHDLEELRTTARALHREFLHEQEVLHNMLSEQTDDEEGLVAHRARLELLQATISQNARDLLTAEIKHDLRSERLVSLATTAFLPLSFITSVG